MSSVEQEIFEELRPDQRSIPDVFKFIKSVTIILQ